MSDESLAVSDVASGGGSLSVKQLQDALSLSPFTSSMVVRFLEKEGLESLPHVLPWLSEVVDAAAASTDDKVSRAKSVLSPPSRWQRGCPEIIPGLSSHFFWHNQPSLVELLLSPTSPADGRDCCLSLRPLAEAVKVLQDAYTDIREEFLNLRGKHVFQPYRAPGWAHGRKLGSGDGGQSQSTSTDSHHATDGGNATAGAGQTMSADKNVLRSPHNAAGGVSNSAAGDEGGSTGSGATEGTDAGRWSICYLELHGAEEAASCEGNLKLCPRTKAALERIPRRYGHSLFSCLAPGSHITTHTGPTNKKLRLHLPLVVPRDSGSDGGENTKARIRVGPEVVAWREGEVIILDDSHQHEAWNGHSTGQRVVLIVDVWHPELTNKEVKVLELIRNAQLRAAKAMSKADDGAGAGAGGAGSDDFFSVLRKGTEEGGIVGEDKYVFGPLEDAPCKDD